LSKTFRLSQSFAGVTLLAFGAGAPDVFASLSASEGATAEGIHMGISVLLGSSLFILAIVTSLVVFSSPKDIKLNKHFFLRDCFFLLVA
jgi:solute carrier family 24 (sodium/potassium/calcium exchanger), member 6